MTDWTPLPELRKGQGHTRAAVKRRTALRRLALKMLDEIIKAHKRARMIGWTSGRFWNHKLVGDNAATMSHAPHLRTFSGPPTVRSGEG